MSQVRGWATKGSWFWAFFIALEPGPWLRLDVSLPLTLWEWPRIIRHPGLPDSYELVLGPIEAHCGMYSTPSETLAAIDAPYD